MSVKRQVQSKRTTELGGLVYVRLGIPKNVFKCVENYCRFAKLDMHAFMADILVDRIRAAMDAIDLGIIDPESVPKLYGFDDS
ncbi:MAG: hypothetical protein QW587_05560 [Candidatus Bathyarchaeia archaeon]